MPKQKGTSKTGGRRKGTPNKSTQALRDILENNRDKLLTKAIKMAQDGNATIMCKLLDKLLPSLNNNQNTNTNMTLEDFLLKRKLQEKEGEKAQGAQESVN